MSNLIKNELIKIFKKKSIYITLLVVLAFVILTNCIYKFFNNSNSYMYSDNYIKYVKEDLAKLDPNKASDLAMYIDLTTQLEIYEMIEKFDKDAWQRDIISRNIATYIGEKNTYKYGTDKDEEKVKQLEEKINKVLEKLNQDDWRYFAKLELEEAENALKNLKEQKNSIIDKQQIETIESSIKNTEIDKQVAKYRVDKDIKYGTDYRNTALNQYYTSSKEIVQLEEEPEELKNYENKKQYNKSIERREINKYILDNDVDINKSNDTRGILKNFFNEYGLFVIVMIVMIAGTIVSEEFNKGTIKLLLVKPYSRNKILLSKFLTMTIMIIFSIAIIIVMQLIVGGIISGFDSLSVPIVQYNFNTQSLEVMNIFAYLGLQTLTQLPMLILLATLAFAFSTIFTNSALAITIALLGYMSTSVINTLVIQYKVQFMKFFVTMNWDFSGYLFGNLPNMEGMTPGFSIIMCILYFIIMIIPTFIIFKKKNIKNI